MQRSKVYREKMTKLGTKTQTMDTAAAVDVLKSVARDWESVDLDVRLNINTRKADQNIRGTTILPHGTGKTPRILILAKDDRHEEAREAGADHVGLEDLIEKIKGGWTEFDMVIATPDVMKDVSQVAKVLGPRGLMPNPKSGTVTADIKGAVQEAKAGKIEYRADKTGIVHASVGRANFSAEQLRDNITHLINVLLRVKPSSVKGHYVKSIHLSSTQSPSLKLDSNNFSG